MTGYSKFDVGGISSSQMKPMACLHKKLQVVDQEGCNHDLDKNLMWGFSDVTWENEAHRKVSRRLLAPRQEVALTAVYWQTRKTSTTQLVASYCSMKSYASRKTEFESIYIVGTLHKASFLILDRVRKGHEFCYGE